MVLELVKERVKEPSSPGSKRSPLNLSFTISAIPPILEPITGVPVASASSIVIGKPSYHVEGKIKDFARFKLSIITALGWNPRY